YFGVTMFERKPLHVAEPDVLPGKSVEFEQVEHLFRDRSGPLAALGTDTQPAADQGTKTETVACPASLNFDCHLVSPVGGGWFPSPPCFGVRPPWLEGRAAHHFTYAVT